MCSHVNAGERAAAPELGVQERINYMQHYDFSPHGVCARAIHIDLSDDGTTIEHVSFDGGCNGNLKAISSLVSGLSVDKVASLLAGNTCGKRPTSCADQMVCGLREAQQALDARAS